LVQDRICVDVPECVTVNPRLPGYPAATASAELVKARAVPLVLIVPAKDVIAAAPVICGLTEGAPPSTERALEAVD
jgi:hypothetical protein